MNPVVFCTRAHTGACCRGEAAEAARRLNRFLPLSPSSASAVRVRPPKFANVTTRAELASSSPLPPASASLAAATGRCRGCRPPTDCACSSTPSVCKKQRLAWMMEPGQGRERRRGKKEDHVRPEKSLVIAVDNDCGHFVAGFSWRCYEE